MQLAKPAGVTLHWGMQCRWVLGHNSAWNGLAPWRGKCHASLRAGVPPLRPQISLGAAPHNKKYLWVPLHTCTLLDFGFDRFGVTDLPMNFEECVKIFVYDLKQIHGDKKRMSSGTTSATWQMEAQPSVDFLWCENFEKPYNIWQINTNQADTVSKSEKIKPYLQMFSPWMFIFSFSVERR